MTAKGSMTEPAGLSCLDITGPEGITRGANQLWYPTHYQRLSGCGPTAAGMLLWHLSRTRAGWEALCPYEGATRAGFTQLMEEMFRYVTPGPQGVNKTSILSEGIAAYAGERGFALEPTVLNVPAKLWNRPSRERVEEFLLAALDRGVTVAFLNLSNGSLRNLDSWHWVLLTGYCPEAGRAAIYDAGRRLVIDMAQWLRTTTLGGGFVSVL